MRNTDNNKSKQFRTGSRFFCAEGTWWFTTREGEEGPFKSREDAQVGLQWFIDSQKILSAKIGSKVVVPSLPRSRKIGGGAWHPQIDSI